MRLSAYCITHHNCPVEVRERLMLDQDQQSAFLKQCHAHNQIREACILQTCNRLEFYLVAAHGFDQQGFIYAQIQYLRKVGQLWLDNVVIYEGLDAARHLFAVSAGLDSQVVGENQILAQVKAAYSQAVAAHTSRLILNRLFHLAFRVGKDVRTNTSISKGAVSIAQAAVDLASQYLDLRQAKVLLVGAGDNAQLVAKVLCKRGIKGLVIANRDQAKAAQLCEALGCGRAIRIDQIPRALRTVNLLVSSTSSPDSVITTPLIGPVLANRKRPILMIDLAVPRDIDPALGAFRCVRIKDLDDIDQHVQQGRSSRIRQLPKAQVIVEQYVAQFQQWYESLAAVPIISGLTQMASSIAKTHAARYGRRFCQKDQQMLISFAESLAKKLLHRPVSFLRQIGSEPDADQLAAVGLIRKVFQIDDGQG